MSSSVSESDSTMIGRKKLIICSIVALALILVPTLSVTALSQTPNFPKGTVCGDAQIGPWSVSQFVGNSNFQGFYSLFTLNNFALSGGNSGTVTSSSGTLKVYSSNPHTGGRLLFSATFTAMSGKYSISGSKMILTNFRANNIHVTMNKIHHRPDSRVKVGNFNSVNIPNRAIPQISCIISDTLVSFTP